MASSASRARDSVQLPKRMLPLTVGSHSRRLCDKQVFASWVREGKLHLRAPMGPKRARLEPRCQYRCKFCFATFEDIPNNEVVKGAEQLLAVPRALRDHGADKLTFVGGEPLLHPLLEPLLREAKSVGLTTMMVTNGGLLTKPKLAELRPHLDWLTFSIDASRDDLHAEIGRGDHRELRSGVSGHLERCRELWAEAKRLGYR